MEQTAATKFLEAVFEPIHNKRSPTVREFGYLHGITDALGLGTAYFNQLIFQCDLNCDLLHQKLLQHPSFDKGLFAHLISSWNEQQTQGTAATREETHTNTLTENDMEFWHEHGYVVVENIITRDQALQISDGLLTELGMLKDSPASWYKRNSSTIMVEIYQNKLLAVARKSKKARAAFEQLWQRESLICSVDRMSVNPPDTFSNPFAGPGLHLDVNFDQPLYFGTQGIVYLNNVAENQGALTLCPGFHLKYPQWLENLDQGMNPNDWDFTQLSNKPISANAGDLIIWHHWLPHGSSPNKNNFPRIAQYLNMYSLEPKFIAN